MHKVWGIKPAVLWSAALAVIFVAGCHSSARAIRKNPRVQAFDFQIEADQNHYHIEGYLARSPVPGRRPALLVINPSGDAVKCIKSSLALTQLDMQVACISLPGSGKSSGPGRFVGPQAVVAARHALDLLAQRSDVDPARLGVWGVTNGAVAAGLLMDVDSRPRVVILQSGAYDMTKYWPEAGWFTKLWILHQVWPSKRVLKERSVIEHLPAKLKCKVLILHGEEDKHTPVHQAEQLATALQERGASVTTRYFPEGDQKLGRPAYAAVVEFLRANLAPPSASGYLLDGVNYGAGMPVHLHFGKNLANRAVAIDHEGGSLDAHKLASVKRFLLVDPVGLGNRLIGVGEQRKVEFVLGSELVMRLRRIGADPHDLGAGRFDTA